MSSKPKRKGYVLTEWAEDMYSEWEDIGGCSCCLGGAPCQSCTHEGHPISLEENDEAWEIDLDCWNFSYPINPRYNIKDFLDAGWTYDQMITAGYLKFKEEEEMARDNVVNKATTKDSPSEVDTHVHTGFLPKCESKPYVEGKIHQQVVTGTINFNQQEETKMSNANNRRLISVQIFDLDPALDVEHSLVHIFKDVITEDDNETTKAEILHTGALVEPLKKHNENRVKQDNRDILNRTGKKVKLEPVKVKNLTFKFV